MCSRTLDQLYDLTAMDESWINFELKIKKLLFFKFRILYRMNQKLTRRCIYYYSYIMHHSKQETTRIYRSRQQLNSPELSVSVPVHFKLLTAHHSVSVAIGEMYNLSQELSVNENWSRQVFWHLNHQKWAHQRSIRLLPTLTVHWLALKDISMYFCSMLR